MKRLTCSLVAALLVLVSPAIVLANPTSVDLEVTSEQVADGSNVALRFIAKAFFNEPAAAGTPCRVLLAGTVSRLGEPNPGRPGQRILKRQRLRPGRNQITFRYLGPAVDGRPERQTQGTFQVRVHCRGESLEQRFVSSAEAINVTCDGGVLRRDFLPLMSQRLRSRASVVQN